MKKRIRVLICLHILLLLYSMGGICSKMAAGFPFLSLPFIGYYAGLIAILGIYAIGWQQIIKRLPLTLAYANRAVGAIWTCVWSVLVFHERISTGKLVGIFVIIAGVVLYALSEGEEHE